MTASVRPRLRSEISRGHSVDDPNEGTSARTRPFSYDDIMHRRKIKKDFKGSEEEALQVEHSGRGETAENLDHVSQEAKHATGKHSRKNGQDTRSKEKEEKSYKVQDSHGNSNNKGSENAENPAKRKREKDRMASTESVKADRQGHLSGRVNEETLGMDPRSKHKYEKDMRTCTESVRADRQGHVSDRFNVESLDMDSRSKHKHQKDSRFSTESLKADRHGHVSGKFRVESLDMDSRYKRKHEVDVKKDVKAPNTNRRGHVGGKLDEECLDLDSRSKHQHEKDVRNRTEASKNDGRRHASGRIDEATHDMNARTKYRHEKDMKNRTAAVESDWLGHVSGEHAVERSDVKSRSKHKPEKDVRGDTKGLTNDRRGHVRSKQDERLRDTGKYDYEIKHHRDPVPLDRYLERSEGALEREKKRKDRAGDDEKIRIRDPVKEHDIGREPDSGIPEIKEKMELSHPHNNESRSKRRRSRSQELSKEKVRRSRSASPQVQKKIVSDKHDRGQLPSSSHRDRSRHQSDVDRSKMSGSGSANHHRRHNGSSSGLGGYSPRKRKTEAAVKTPSPIHSPERKRAGWDRPASGSDINLSAPAGSGSQLVSQTMPSNLVKLATSSSVASNFEKPLSSLYFQSLPTFKVQASVDSVQLTQATRPMRRLYIDNVPASASERDIMECFNTFLLSSGSNHIRGTHPCISCMIHKEKGQALLEFLTPEDASSALSFDGRSLHGCSIKIRRPKDYVDMASGSVQRLKAGVATNSAINDVPVSQVVEDAVVSNVVKDSPNKIFVGGIAEGLSSEMVMAIVSAFGPLKSFHFDINEDLNEPCAFLEYTDHSTTLKACAGLNGMKLGGSVLTVTQAVPNSSLEENTESKPLYGIPEHVRHLLETPTQVLKLSNVLNQEVMELLPDTEVEEILEDVRLECSRFGTVVSVNVVKDSNMLAVISEPNEVRDDIIDFPPRGEGEFCDHHLHSDIVEVAKNCNEAVCGEGEPLATVRYSDAVVSAESEKHDMPTLTAAGNAGGEACGAHSADELIGADKSVQPSCETEAGKDSEYVAFGDSTIDSTAKTDSSGVNLEESIQESGVSWLMERKGDIVKLCDEGTHHTDDLQQEAAFVSNACGREKPEAAENSAKNDNASNIRNRFEVGCVLVEFRRAEASCMAAHGLHGRLFDDRIVSVEYVPLEAYRARFPK